MLIASMAFTPAAQSATSKLYVTPSFDYTGFCRPAADQLMWAYTFKAKIKRKNSPLPRRVTIKYSVTDANTGAVLVAQTLTLKPRKFYKVGALTTYIAGTPIILRATASFRSPQTGKLLKSKTTFNDAVPTVEQMDANGIPVATCAVG
ncbi:MAG: hypothetical protein HZB14_01435 [Actinobacteria bacterium]|nr:hypothetical protein [Actinomycetota bacterium]